MLPAALITLLLAAPSHAASCDSVKNGYHCRQDISHSWGQYSPFFRIKSNISEAVPPKCTITDAIVLSRHGARDPTASKTAAYNATIQKIHTNVQNYTGKYAFLANYTYTLGADQLTTFGQQEMFNSGVKFYRRYARLARALTPFIRASSEARVVESADNFTQGYHAAKLADKRNKQGDSAYPYPILVISEAAGSNNTLNHDLCTNFETGPDKSIASSAQATWTAVWVPDVQSRLNNDLPGANLTTTDVIYLMDLCPFNTVASSTGAISPFCNLFSDEEWQNYDYYETLNKYYGYSYGNPLGPTQGVGWTNELIARFTNSPVMDGTSTNSTLDNDPSTFPLRSHLYADFSHDNDMTAIFSAIGLYNGTAALSNTTREDVTETNGYSAAWTVPFAARAYFEKMACVGSDEELVRIIVNDRVVPLTQCGADNYGRCTLSTFIDSLTFAQSNGLWDQCFS